MIGELDSDTRRADEPVGVPREGWHVFGKRLCTLGCGEHEFRGVCDARIPIVRPSGKGEGKRSRSQSARLVEFFLQLFARSDRFLTCDIFKHLLAAQPPCLVHLCPLFSILLVDELEPVDHDRQRRAGCFLEPVDDARVPSAVCSYYRIDAHGATQLIAGDRRFCRLGGRHAGKTFLKAQQAPEGKRVLLKEEVEVVALVVDVHQLLLFSHLPVNVWGSPDGLLLADVYVVQHGVFQCAPCAALHDDI